MIDGSNTLPEAGAQAEICCPKFDPSKWDGKTFEWKDKSFILDKVFTIFYMPLNYGAVMTKLDKKIRAAGALMPDLLYLAENTSMWNMNLYVAVDKVIPDANNVMISGKYICKVYEGDFSKTGDWMKDFAKFTEQKGLKIGKTYMWYTTCPKCAKKYGKNYVGLFGEIV